MKSPKRRPETLRALCAEPGEDDGMDPRDVYSRAGRDSNKTGERKNAQLCKQVARAIESALAACADVRLHELEVVRVEPAPNAGRLRVVVRVSSGGEPRDTNALALILTAATGHIRSEIALVVTRKRVPEITFQIMEDPDVTT